MQHVTSGEYYMSELLKWMHLNAPIPLIQFAKCQHVHDIVPCLTVIQSFLNYVMHDIACFLNGTACHSFILLYSFSRKTLTDSLHFLEIFYAGNTSTGNRVQTMSKYMQ